MKIKRLIFLITGCVCLALDCIGIVLPVLPTVPFFLATVFCFSQSSQKLHDWFLGTRMYKNNLASYVKGQGMTAKTKTKIFVHGHGADGFWLRDDAAEGAAYSLRNTRRRVGGAHRVLHLFRKDSVPGREL